MTKVSTIGLDLAKHVFQVHGVDECGGVMVRRRLRRSEVLKYFARLEPTIVGMEACSTSHYWARELRALGHGPGRANRVRGSSRSSAGGRARSPPWRSPTRWRASPGP